MSVLTDRWADHDPFAYDPAELAGAQLAAAQERFDEHRQAIRVLDRRADDAGVDHIEAFDDLVALLFSHSTYKSYPDAFVRKGRWDRLAAWLGTLSTRPITDVDFDGVTDIDGWVARLHDAGHHVMTTSGTTGRTSFLDTSPADHAALVGGYVAGGRGMAGYGGAPDRAAFLAIPPGTTTVAQLAMTLMAAEVARPGDVHHISDQPLLAADLARIGELRQAIAKGTASPSDIAAAEATARDREARMGAQLEAFVSQVVERHEEPLFIAGTFGLLWRIVETAKAQGIGDGDFHPETLLLTGGGLKGVRAPADFQAQIRAFFGPGVPQLEAYGMSELNGPFPRCAEGRYHAPPTSILLVLDKAGEHLLNTPGEIVTGRCAVLDLTVDARWGGVISGDQVTVDFGPCRCGRASPSVVAITRYSDLPEGDDKLSCSGAVDAYVRGEIEASA